MTDIATREQTLAILSRGKDATGEPIHLGEFDRKSRKTLSELCEETRTGEARLLLAPDGRIDMLAESVAITVECGVEELLETGRIYLRKPESPVIHATPRFWTARETMLPGESVFDAAQRCLFQEWGMTPSEYLCREHFIGSPERDIRDTEFFKGVLAPDPGHDEEWLPTYESEAYYGLRRKVKIHRMRLVMHEKRWPNGRKLKDNGTVFLLLKWHIIETFSTFLTAAAGT